MSAYTELLKQYIRNPQLRVGLEQILALVPTGEKGDTGNTGAAGASVASAAFVGDDLVFTLSDASTVTISNAKVDLKGDTGNAGAAAPTISSVAFVGDDMVFTLSDATTVTIAGAKTTLKGDTGDSAEVESGTPVNAEAATEALTIGGDVIDGEFATINGRKYEFDWDGVVAEGAVAVDVSGDAAKSTNNLTVDTNPTAGDTKTIGTKEYIFVPDGTANAEGEIAVGALLADTQANIIAAIKGTDGHNTANDAATCGAAFAMDVLAITALEYGTAGDSIATTSSFTAGTNGFSAANLGSGGDVALADAEAALIAAITGDESAVVTAASGGAGVVNVTAKIKGTVGNYALTEDMANGAWGDTDMSGGIDGTVADAGKLLYDATNLYGAVAANTTADANWKKVPWQSL